MNNEIPISTIHKNDIHLLYFDTCYIHDPDKINKAYILVEHVIYCDINCSLSISVNDYLSEEELKLIHENKQITSEYSLNHKVLADVSEIVKMIASGYTKNNGIILKNIKHLCNPRLILYYYQEKIYPRNECIFFEKKLNFLNYTYQIKSPWFFSGISDNITFFIHNNSNYDITVHIENSPDAIKYSKDAQKIYIHKNSTIDIVPYKFSKFIRLVINSDKRVINCNIWFQTQLKNNYR